MPGGRVDRIRDSLREDNRSFVDERYAGNTRLLGIAHALLEDDFDSARDTHTAPPQREAASPTAAGRLMALALIAASAYGGYWAYGAGYLDGAIEQYRAYFEPRVIYVAEEPVIEEVDPIFAGLGRGYDGGYDEDAIALFIELNEPPPVVNDSPAASGGGSSSGSSGGGSSGGSSGGGGGGGSSTSITRVQTATWSSHARIDVDATVTTSGSMSVSCYATANGSSFALNGPSSVNGTATYSGSKTSLSAGTYTVKVFCNGAQKASTSVTVS